MSPTVPDDQFGGPEPDDAHFTGVILRINDDGTTPADNPLFQADPHFRDRLLFFEYFHGETGRGVGASHQTGWTALATRFVEALGQNR